MHTQGSPGSAVKLINNGKWGEACVWQDLGRVVEFGGRLGRGCVHIYCLRLLAKTYTV